jgi:hypothetical protein
LGSAGEAIECRTLPCIILIVWPTLPGIIIAQVISGASFGLYSVADQAMLSRVIPAESNAARDLGVLNIAGAVPLGRARDP